MVVIMHHPPDGSGGTQLYIYFHGFVNLYASADLVLSQFKQKLYIPQTEFELASKLNIKRMTQR